MKESTEFVEKLKKVWQAVRKVFGAVGKAVDFICHWVYRLRKVAMAVPVLWMALKLAKDNMARLPEVVGLNMQSTGEYAISVTRSYAVYGPLGVTVFTLLLMFCSRKATYPWIVSIFTLALPWLIYLTNLYPG